MIKYNVNLRFTNIDDNLYTPGAAEINQVIEADDEQTAYALARHLKRLFAADHYFVSEVKNAG